MEKADQDLAQAKDLFEKKLISQTEMLAAPDELRCGQVDV
jgi:hypothetical protein